MESVKNFEMRERKEPIFIEFKKPGEEVGGVLLRVDRIKVQRRDEKNEPIKGQYSHTLRYLFERGDLNDAKFVPDGERFCFLGTRRILDDIWTNDVGKYVLVRFEGVDTGVVKNGNGMKIFRIWVSNHAPEGAGGAKGLSSDPLEITDDDIPF